MAPSLAVSGIACYSGVVVLLLHRLWNVYGRAAAHRKRQRQTRAWVELASTWHTPLLLAALALTIARLAFFLEVYGLHRHPYQQVLHHHPYQHSTPQRRRLWFWLELPSALAAMVIAYLLFFHAHVALYLVWPIRLDSTAVTFRILLVAFCGLLLAVVVLLACGREASEPIFSPREWTRVSLHYCAVVWIVLGALLLKFAGDAADVMWTERGAGRLLVISPRGLHALFTTETLYALVTLARGMVAGALAMAAASPLPVDPARIELTPFLLLYGLWELTTLGVIYALCGCVPVVSRARRLVGSVDDSQSGRPIVDQQPVLHFELPGPTQAVRGYLSATATILHSRSRGTRRPFDETSSVEMDAGDAEDGLLLEEDSFHEPLLSEPQNHDDLEEPLERRDLFLY